METKPKCNTTYQYFGNNAMEVPVGESLTDVTCDIPLMVLIDRLQRGISTGLGTGLPMACDIVDGDESILDTETPHITDKIDSELYFRSKIQAYNDEKKNAQIKLKTENDKKYKEFLVWKEQNKDVKGSEEPITEDNK